VSEVADTQITLVHADPVPVAPYVTELIRPVAEPKPVPVRVTVVATNAAPVAGLTAEMTGMAIPVYVADVNVLVTPLIVTTKLTTVPATTSDPRTHVSRVDDTQAGEVHTPVATAAAPETVAPVP